MRVKHINFRNYIQELMTQYEYIGLKTWIADEVVVTLGTGKTTTLVQLAQRNPGMKFLNLAYNR